MVYFSVSSWEFVLESLNLLFLLEAFALSRRRDTAATIQFFNTFNLIDLKYSTESGGFRLTRLIVSFSFPSPSLDFSAMTTTCIMQLSGRSFACTVVSFLIPFHVDISHFARRKLPPFASSTS